jgi:RimJ/RimL family protein N-acetyltransferase
MLPVSHSGIDIGEMDYWGKGYGKEATQLALDFAFNFLNIHNIMLGVYAFNQRAYHLYKKIGFKEIGRKREFQTLGGEKFDMIMMDLLSTEYESVYVKPLLQRMEE